jgi:hypothetical protein
MSEKANMRPELSMAPAPTRLRQIAFVTSDLPRAKRLLVRLPWSTGSAGYSRAV